MLCAPLPGHLPNPGIEYVSFISCIAGKFLLALPRKPQNTINGCNDTSLEIGGYSAILLYSLNSGFVTDGLFFSLSFSPFSTQLSQPAVSIEGQVSNPPSTSSTEVNSQTIPEKQPSQEVKMEPKMEVEAPEPADTQPEDIPEVRGGQLLPLWVRNMLQERTLIICLILLISICERVLSSIHRGE